MCARPIYRVVYLQSRLCIKKKRDKGGEDSTSFFSLFVCVALFNFKPIMRKEFNWLGDGILYIFIMRSITSYDVRFISD